MSWLDDTNDLTRPMLVDTREQFEAWKRLCTREFDRIYRDESRRNRSTRPSVRGREWQTVAQAQAYLRRIRRLFQWICDLDNTGNMMDSWLIDFFLWWDEEVLRRVREFAGNPDVVRLTENNLFVQRLVQEHVQFWERRYRKGRRRMFGFWAGALQPSA